MNRLVYILFLVFSLFFCTVSAADKKAQKAQKPTKMSTLYKNANTALKNQSGQDGARDQLLAAVQRQDIKNKDRAKIYYTAALLERSIHRGENTKAYLKQAYDSAKFFSKLRDMYHQLQLCDSIDNVPAANGKLHPHYGSKIRALRLKYRRNLVDGAKYFLSKKDYATTYTFLDLYCSNDCDEATDVEYPRAVQWAALCGFAIESPQKTLRYVDKAIQYADSATAVVLCEYKARCYDKLQNDTACVEALWEGIRRFPTHDYFFVHLQDYYYVNRDFPSALALADTLIAVNPANPLYYYAKSKVALAENSYEECVVYSDSVISRDPDFVDAHYNKGIAYLNLAIIQQEASCSDMTDPKCVADREKTLYLYQQARPCMEAVRRLQPDKQERWASPLYRIYLNLNMGKEFNELDRLLHPNNH